MYPYPPWIWIASRADITAASLMWSFATAASRPETGRPPFDEERGHPPDPLPPIDGGEGDEEVADRRVRAEGLRAVEDVAVAPALGARPQRERVRARVGLAHRVGSDPGPVAQSGE